MKELLKKRTKNIAIMVWQNCQKTGDEFKDYKNQLIRCSSSVGANYRAACRAKSAKDFLNKLKIVEEELDETKYFIELIVEIKPDLNSIWEKSYKEAEELLNQLEQLDLKSKNKSKIE